MKKMQKHDDFKVEIEGRDKDGYYLYRSFYLSRLNYEQPSRQMRFLRELTSIDLDAQLTVKYTMILYRETDTKRYSYGELQTPGGNPNIVITDILMTVGMAFDEEEDEEEDKEEVKK